LNRQQIALATLPLAILAFSQVEICSTEGMSVLAGLGKRGTLPGGIFLQTQESEMIRITARCLPAYVIDLHAWRNTSDKCDVG
jgi:predicted aconitase with swiveling domain